MFTAALILAAAVAADEPAVVQVKLLVRTEGEKADVAVEPWVVMAVIKSSDESAVPLTDWVPLTNKETRIHSGNGFYVDGTAALKKSGKGAEKGVRESAGLNRSGVANERVVRARFSQPLGPEPYADGGDAVGVAWGKGTRRPAIELRNHHSRVPTLS